MPISCYIYSKYFVPANVAFPIWINTIIYLRAKYISGKIYESFFS